MKIEPTRITYTLELNDYELQSLGAALQKYLNTLTKEDYAGSDPTEARRGRHLVCGSRTPADGR